MKISDKELRQIEAEIADTIYHEGSASRIVCAKANKVMDRFRKEIAAKKAALKK